MCRRLSKPSRRLTLFRITLVLTVLTSTLKQKLLSTALCLLFLFAAAAATPIPECAACHPAETRLHSQTRMAHAMIQAPASAFAQHVFDRPLREPDNGFEISYQRVPTGLRVTAQRGDQSAVGIIEWVLGAGQQGQTPLVRADNALFESRVSYFTRLNQFGITIGQPSGASSQASSALGLKESYRDAKSCLACHSTGVTDNLEPVVPGVQCERCHAGATEHANGSGHVSNPGKLSALDQLRVCGACHRLTPPVDDTQLENVRFQPLRLQKSRCFTSSKLTCTTCHVAHQDARRDDPRFYNDKCKTCHSAPTSLRHADNRKDGNCISCHMQVVQLHVALKFTDHYIRVLPPASQREALP
jgi:hypothetical protein